MEDGQRIIVKEGGKGGLGNWHFRSSTNQTPRYAQPGTPGQEGWVIMELEVPGRRRSRRLSQCRQIHTARIHNGCKT